MWIGFMSLVVGTKQVPSMSPKGQAKLQHRVNKHVDDVTGPQQCAASKLSPRLTVRTLCKPPS
jgi:hypothetical protein